MVKKVTHSNPRMKARKSDLNYDTFCLITFFGCTIVSTPLRKRKNYNLKSASAEPF